MEVIYLITGFQILTNKVMSQRRNIKDCKHWKPRGKTTHYCKIDKTDPLKRCYGVCKKFEDINSTESLSQ